jgi:acyl carrier protein
LNDSDFSEQQKLIHEIQTLLLEKLSIRVESTEMDLFQAGILDSAAQVHLLLQLEQHFGVRLQMEDLEVDSFASVVKIAEAVAAGANTQGIRPASNATPSAFVTPERRKLIREIQELFLEKLSIRVEAEEAGLFQLGVFDSMTLVQFIFHLEERYEFRLPMEEMNLESFHSVAKIAELVGAHLRKNGRGTQTVGETETAADPLRAKIMLAS